MHAFRHNHRYFHLVEANRTFSVIFAFEIRDKFIGKSAWSVFSKSFDKSIRVYLSVVYW